MHVSIGSARLEMRIRLATRIASVEATCTASIAGAGMAQLGQNVIRTSNARTHETVPLDVRTGYVGLVM